MFFRPKKLYKYLSADGAQQLFSSNNPAIWFRLSNRLNDIYDLRPIGSYADEFGALATFCLSESPSSAPMWAHYGSGGEGVILEFSLQSEFFAKIPPIKVRYRTKRPTVKNAREALITKNVEWAYEREWRSFVSLPQTHSHNHQFLPSEQAVSIPFPFEALTAVIHGYDSRVSTGKFLGMPEASHIEERVCRARAWDYGLNICTLDDMNHLLENRDAAVWGRKQKR